jgi:ATP-dependent RNA helicase DeaD
MTTFRDIVTDDTVLRALDDMKFDTPTEIQEAVLPHALEGKDIIGQAKTGSGKTFAFGIPILHVLSEVREPQALILAPTRELCQQITVEMKKLSKHHHAKVVAIYGGVSINPQIDDLSRGMQIVVGTPGRVLDHLERGTLETSHIRTLVLDEADRMLDMGFIDDVQRILHAVPDSRQTMLFSATIPDVIKELARRYMLEPEYIRTQTHVDEEFLPQYYVVVEHNRKFSLLLHMIKEEKPTLGIIFCATRTIAEMVARNLQRHHVVAESLHGGHSQAKRDNVMNGFRDGKVHILIATDVASRGLDIKNVSHIFNYDVPKNSEDYIHRIGRTARAGEHGKAITLLESRDYEFFNAVLELPNVHATELKIEDFQNVGFRKYEEYGEERGGYGSRGGYGGERRGPRREGSGYGGGQRRSSSGERSEGRRESRSSEHEAGQSESHHWHQSRRKR